MRFDYFIRHDEVLVSHPALNWCLYFTLVLSHSLLSLNDIDTGKINSNRIEQKTSWEEIKLNKNLKEISINYLVSSITVHCVDFHVSLGILVKYKKTSDF